MKHAFLIIAHNEYPVLEVLLSMLDDERNDIYLHIDKRATELFQQIKKVKMQKAGFYLTLNPQLHSRSATYIKRNGLLIRKITIKSSRPFQCAYHPLTP